MASRLYDYVGPPEVAASVRGLPAGTPIKSEQDLKAWLVANREDLDRAGTIIATFVIDKDGLLRMAQRRTEHVACASGGPVRSAGEISFTIDGRIAYVSNQSTGFCPEAESWPAVAAAIKDVVPSPPNRFSQEFIFRRCTSCGQTLVIKDNWFVCDLCDADVPTTWNFGRGE
jgi:hypothetical protein